MSADILVAASADPIFPVRVLAMFAVGAVIFSFIYVLRHLKQIQRLLLFLIIKA